MQRPVAILSAVLALVLAGCASHRPPSQAEHREREWHPPIEMLAKYADTNGNVTRASMEAGLRRDFDAADKNHDGVLGEDEVRAINETRWKEAESAYSPLVDWNGDGVVNFDEFAATARSLFQQLDTQGKGIITAQQLKALQMGPRSQDDDENEAGEGQDRGRRGRGRGGDQGGPPDRDGSFRLRLETSWH
jgi:hypothetical protein